MRGVPAAAEEWGEADLAVCGGEGKENGLVGRREKGEVLNSPTKSTRLDGPEDEVDDCIAIAWMKLKQVTT